MNRVLLGAVILASLALPAQAHEPIQPECFPVYPRGGPYAYCEIRDHDTAGEHLSDPRIVPTLRVLVHALDDGTHSSAAYVDIDAVDMVLFRVYVHPLCVYVLSYKEGRNFLMDRRNLAYEYTDDPAPSWCDGASNEPDQSSGGDADY